VLDTYNALCYNESRLTKDETMKFIKTKNTYKASNVELNLNTMTAVSYNWWTFLKVIDGQLVFNSYAYSPSTQRQQYKVLKVLAEKGIKLDFIVESRKSLTDSSLFEDAKELIQHDIDDLITAMNKKGSQKAKNSERAKRIEFLKQKKFMVDLFIQKSHVMAALVQ
jgi:hypothetical protein